MPLCSLSRFGGVAWMVPTFLDPIGSLVSTLLVSCWLLIVACHTFSNYKIGRVEYWKSGMLGECKIGRVQDLKSARLEE